MPIVAITSAEHLDRYRAIRLEALATDPDAFGSTLQHESVFDDARWRQRLDTFQGEPGQVYLATIGSRDIGVAGVGLRRGDRAPDAMLWGMWVRPADRGQGAARDLIGATVEWARRQGADEIVLAVRRGNTAAVGLYRAEGFVETDELGIASDDPCAGELGMRRLLV